MKKMRNKNNVCEIQNKMAKVCVFLSVIALNVNKFKNVNASKNTNQQNG